MRPGKIVERYRAAVGDDIGREGASRCCGRYVGCITHLQLMELVAVAEDVGADEGDRVCEVGIVSVEVVTGWSSV